MEQKQLRKFRTWFDKYAAGFYGDDDFVNANIKLKQEHSHRVCKEMRYLTRRLGLGENQRRIADTIALFHDVGRFEQFVRYRTYSDTKSISHSLLGVEILRRTNTLDGVDEGEKKLIEKAIEYHGIKELPEDLNGDCLLLSKLIRDADKLDIFRVALEIYRQYRDNPQAFRFEVELPPGPGYSPEVLDKILKQQKIDYALLRTWNDMKLLQLGWVYDVNFTAALERIKKRKFLEELIAFLPQNEDIKKVERKIFEYIDRRIERNEK